MPPPANGETRISELLAGAAVLRLGRERAAELSGALGERAAQLALVSEAAAALPPSAAASAPSPATAAPAPPSQPPAAAPATPGPASMAAWRECSRRADELDGRLRAWAWRAPVPGSRADQPAGGPPAGYPPAGGQPGALDGYVIGVKDNIDAAGMPARAGSPLTSPDPVAADAPAVARLRAAGAAIAGKTQCTEWALNDPAPTCNPWDPGRTPGGSSAGSAVAVATGMCTASVDTQTAGDVLRPAAYNGVAGFKPTGGWTTADGSQPVAPSIDTLGVTARSVAAAAAVAAALAAEPARFTAGELPHGPRLGVLGAPFPGEAGRADRAGLGWTLRRLSDAGASLAEVACPVDLTLVHAAHRVITFAECAAEHVTGDRDDHHRYRPRARELIDLGLLTPAPGYLQAQRVRADATRRLAAMLAAAPVLILPVTPGPAPDRATTGDSRLQIPWTLCGFPALSLPAGLSPAGLPLAIQLVAGHQQEATLLATARWCERVLAVSLTPPAAQPGR